MIRIPRIEIERVHRDIGHVLASFRNIAVAFHGLPLAAGLAYLVISFTADWWQHFDEIAGLKNLLGIRLLGAFSAALGVGLIAEFLQRTDRSTHWVMAFWLVYLGLLLAVLWPGLLTPDTHAVYLRAFKFPIEDWLGIFSPILYAMVLQVAPHVAFVAVLQVVCCVIALGLWDHVLRNNGAGLWVRLLTQCFLAINVSFLYNVFVLNRDTLFAFSLCILLAFQVHIMFSRETASVRYFVGLGLASAVLCALRTDGLLAVAIAFVAIFLAGRFNARRLLTSGLIFVGLFSLYVPIASAVFGRQSNRFGYALSLTTNPLGYMVNNGFTSDDPDRDLKIIDKAFSLDLLRRLQKPDEIASFWAGGTRYQSNAEERKEYFKTFFRILWNNVGLFLQGRAITFLGSAGLREKHGAIVHKNYVDKIGTNGEDLSGLASTYPFPSARKAVLGLAASTAKFEGITFGGSALYWDFLPYLAVFTVLAIFTPVIPISGFASLTMVSRAAVLFALAGGSQFIYYLPLVMGFPFILAVLWLEVRKRGIGKNR
jgi:hypothetical protein